MSKQNIIFMGSGEFSVLVFKEIYNSQKFEIVDLFSLPDKPVGRKQKLTPTPFRLYASSVGLEVKVASSSSEILSQITSKPDFLIVTDFGIILSEEVLNIPLIECLNVHASLLPKYRGASPIHSAILNLDEVTGVTVMKVVKKMDAGPSYGYSEVKIEYTDNYHDLLYKLGVVGGALLRDLLLKFTTLKSVEQDSSEVTYCKKINKLDGLIDFKLNTASTIFAKFRAFYEWPKIFFVHRDRRFQIVDMYIKDIALEKSMAVIDGELYVRTVEGVVVIREIRPDSKNAMSVAQFLTGNPSFFEASE